MKAKFCSMVIGAVLLALAPVLPSTAAPFNPPEADLEALVNVTTVFGPTQLSTIDSISTAGPGINANVTWRVGSGGLGGETFSRVVLQKPNFNADLSAADSLDLIFEPDHAGVGVKTFVQTGPSFAFFESPFISLPANTATLVPLDLTGLPDTDNVRQFGFQLFGPAPAVGQTIVGSVRISAVPEPTSFAIAGLVIVLGFGGRWLRRS